MNTILEMTSLCIPPVYTKSSLSDIYNVSKNLYFYFALVNDEVFMKGYLMKEIMQKQNDEYLFNCLCGLITPISKLVEIYRTGTVKQMCEIYSWKGLTRAQCENELNVIKTHIVPFYCEIAGKYTRGSQINIRKCYFIVSREHQEAIRKNLLELSDKLGLDYLHDNVNSHQFQRTRLVVIIIYYDTPQQRMFLRFKYNSSICFFEFAVKTLKLKNVQIDDSNSLFDSRTLKYIEFDSEGEIFALIGSKYIPPQYRIGDCISRYWLIADNPGSGNQQENK